MVYYGKGCKLRLKYAQLFLYTKILPSLTPTAAITGALLDSTIGKIT